jgi:hypothetical protein
VALQDKLSKISLQASRKLFDYTIFINGTETPVIYLSIERNIYDDIETLSVTKHLTTSMVMPELREVPMVRTRTNLVEGVQETDNVFMYDIVPFEVFTKFSDNIEEVDMFIRTLRDENNNPLYLVLKVAELFGNFAHNNLMWKKISCAYYNGYLPIEVQNIVDEYEGVL